MTREEAIKTIEVAIAEVEWEYPMDYAVAFEMAIKALREPEVVRCRECKWFNTDIMECECDDVATDCEGGASFSINFGPDDFCSYGVRKDGAK